MVVRLNYHEFIQAVAELLRTEMGIDYEIGIMKTTKNNGLILQGVSIRCYNNETTPNIYLEGYYSDYRNGRELKHIVTDVINVYKSSNKTIPSFGEMDWESIRDTIILRLVNRDMNRQMLQDCPHKIVMDDLVVTYYLLLDNAEEEIWTARVSNDMFHSFGITLEEMYGVALNNTMRLFPAQIRNMDDIIVDILEDRAVDMNELVQFDGAMFLCRREPEVYVLSNETSIYGATTLLYNDILKKFADKEGKDVIILPSSTHEVILVPQVGTVMDVEYLADMVTEINQKEVAIDDILSNHVYLYSREDNQIKQI